MGRTTTTTHISQHNQFHGALATEPGGRLADVKPRPDSAKLDDSPGAGKPQRRGSSDRKSREFSNRLSDPRTEPADGNDHRFTPEKDLFLGSSGKKPKVNVNGFHEDDDELDARDAPIAATRTSPPHDTMPRYKPAERKRPANVKPDFGDPLAELEAAAQPSLEAAADRASHKRSFHTGLPRGLPSKKAIGSAKLSDPDQLSFLFGGSAKPKLANEKVDVRKEKEKALAWTIQEQKKYDLDQLKHDLDNQIQTTVNNIKKEQKDMLQDETRQVRRLDKIEQMHTDLEATKAQVKAQGATMRDLAEKAKDSFADFNDARAANLEALKADLDLKDNEMQKLADDTRAKNDENDHHIDKIQAQREKEALEGN